MNKPNSMTDVLNALNEKTQKDQVSIEDLLSRIEGRGFGPMLMAPALIALLPTGAIPGVPSLCGIIIALISAQLVLGKQYPWIPRKLRELTLSQDALENAINRITPYSKKIDRWFKPRLRFLFHPIVQRIMAASCIGLGLVMIPLELVPMTAALPALSIVLASLGLTTRDGVLLLGSMLFFGATSYLVWSQWLS
ncbi:MAG: exopolysaccharide biosynthesis protein [Pseudomonadota bacterium]|nr:exopolysaccharide biosynthesis protein [Pseudomonadota bacterium]